MGCSMSSSSSDDCYGEWTAQVRKNCEPNAKKEEEKEKEKEERTPEAEQPEVEFEDLVLTGSQVLLVRTSWLRLLPNLTAVGKQVFLRIFEFRPSVKRMFPFRDACGDRLIRHPQFIEQARRFMRVIACVVDALDPDLDPLRRSGSRTSAAQRLVCLGRKHVTIEGFLPDYFDVFTRAIVSVWKQELKDDYTEETGEAWAALFAFLIDNLKIGYEAEFRVRYADENKR